MDGASGAAFATAATTYAQNVAGSLSEGSSETHAVDQPAPWPAIHWATSVVLPKPGGADTSVSRDMTPRPRRSIRRARSTALGRGSGACSLVPRRSVTMPASWALRAAMGEGRPARRQAAAAVTALAVAISGLAASAMAAATIGASRLKPLKVIHRPTDSSQTKIGTSAIPE